VANREGSKWKDLKWRPIVIRFVFGEDPSGFGSENVGKKSQLETGSPSLEYVAIIQVSEAKSLP